MKRPLTAKQTAFIDSYTDASGETYNNATQSAIKAGYSSKWANRQAHLLLDNSRLKTAISAKIAKRQAKIEYNYEKAIAELDKIIANLTEQANTGHIQANSALIQVLREKNDITGLHKQRFIDETEQKRELDESEQTEARRLAAIRLRDIA